MKFQGLVACALAFGLLAGCETTTSASPTTEQPMSRNDVAASKGLTQAMADQQYMKFAVARVMAESYAETCPGVNLIQINQWMAVGYFESTMREQGYSPTMVKIANNRVLRSRSELYRAAMADLQRKGVNRDDKASLCAQARKEIAAGSAIGKHLKLG